MAIVKALRRLASGGFGLVAASDQIACDAGAMTVTPTGGTQQSVPDAIGGRVATVNGKPGPTITLSSDDIGALPRSGGQMGGLFQSKYTSGTFAGGNFGHTFEVACDYDEINQSPTGDAGLLLHVRGLYATFVGIQASTQEIGFGGFSEGSKFFPFWSAKNQPPATAADMAAGTNAFARPTVKQVADLLNALTTGLVPAAYAPRRGQFFTALEASGAGRVATVTAAVPSDPGNGTSIAFNHATFVAQAGTLAQFVKTTLGLSDAQLAAIIANARSVTE